MSSAVTGRLSSIEEISPRQYAALRSENQELRNRVNALTQINAVHSEYRVLLDESAESLNKANEKTIMEQGKSIAILKEFLKQQDVAIITLQAQIRQLRETNSTLAGQVDGLKKLVGRLQKQPSGPQ